MITGILFVAIVTIVVLGISYANQDEYETTTTTTTVYDDGTEVTTTTTYIEEEY